MKKSKPWRKNAIKLLDANGSFICWADQRTRKPLIDLEKAKMTKDALIMLEVQKAMRGKHDHKNP